MNLGFYGTSIVKWHPNDVGFISLLKDFFQANVVHTGVPDCSEERTLFELKKTKLLDVAVIFHSSPYSIFVPGWWRDVNTLDRDSLSNKFHIMQEKDILQVLSNPKVREIAEDIASYLGFPNDQEHLITVINYLQNKPNGPVYDVLNEILKTSGNTMDYKKLLLWQQNGISMLEELVSQHSQDKEFYNNLILALLGYKTYLHHADLQMNRYYGSLLQIDQYCLSKNIAVVHCASPYKLPNWFKFSSGVCDYNLCHFQKTYKNISDISSNGISQQGNAIAFEKLKELINAARSRVVYARCPT